MIAPRPTCFPGWASGPSGFAHCTEPLASEKAIGWSANEAPPADYFNWLQSLTYQWLAYVDPAVSKWEEHMLHFGSAAGPTSYTGGLPNYGTIAMVQSASSYGYSMFSPAIQQVRRTTGEMYQGRLFQVGSGDINTAWAYICSPGEIFSCQPTGYEFEISADVDFSQAADYGRYIVGLSNSRVAHSGTTYAYVNNPSQLGWWLNVKNAATGASAMIATSIATGVDGGELNTWQLKINGSSGTTRAYINGVSAQTLNVAPTGVALFFSAGEVVLSQFTPGYRGGPRVGRIVARWTNEWKVP